MPHRQLIIDQIRKIVPETIAKEITSVQPLPQECLTAYEELLELLKDGGTITLEKKVANE